MTSTAPSTVLAADYHRNGVGGVGFYVGIVNDEGRRMLIVSFDDDSDCYTAALDVDQAAAGNIYMFPHDDQPGGNAWRGDQMAAKHLAAIAAVALQ